MPIDDIEDKIDFIVTEIISPNYNLDDFVTFLIQNSDHADLQQYLEIENLSKLSSLITKYTTETPDPEPWDGAARFTEDILKTVDTEKYPVFKQHPYLVEEAIKAEKIEKPENWEKIEDEQKAESVDELPDVPETMEEMFSNIEAPAEKGPGAENSPKEEIGVIAPLEDSLDSDGDISSVKEESEVEDIEVEEPQHDEEEVAAEISEPSIDNIELTVSTIKTENLQIMKEKPTVSLIK